MLLNDVYSSNNAPGNKYLRMFMENKPITLKQACLAKCAECMNGFIDGKNDCGMNGTCPLYSFMPYRKKEKNKKELKKIITDEQIEKMKEGKRKKQSK